MRVDTKSFSRKQAQIHFNESQSLAVLENKSQSSPNFAYLKSQNELEEDIISQGHSIEDLCGTRDKIVLEFSKW